MCAEHLKEEKAGDYEVCGCPMEVAEFYDMHFDQIKGRFIFFIYDIIL